MHLVDDPLFIFQIVIFVVLVATVTMLSKAVLSLTTESRMRIACALAIRITTCVNFVVIIFLKHFCTCVEWSAGKHTKHGGFDPFFLVLSLRGRCTLAATTYGLMLLPD